MERAEAIALGLKQFNTGRPCRNGHMANRYRLGTCTECSRISAAEHQQRVSGTAAERKRCRLKAARDRAVDPEKWNARKRAWAAKNPGSVSKYRQQNLGRFAAWAMKRRARELRQTPPWFDENKARIVYEVAAQMQRELGVKFNVDHVIPLQGKLASGLHVHTNFQILPALENQRKNNRFVI